MNPTVSAAGIPVTVGMPTKVVMKWISTTRLASRIDRLARTVPAWSDRVRTMSDQELHDRLHEALERLDPVSDADLLERTRRILAKDFVSPRITCDRCPKRPQ